MALSSYPCIKCGEYHWTHKTKAKKIPCEKCEKLEVTARDSTLSESSEAKKLVEQTHSKYDGYQVSTSNNGSQWNTIYSDVNPCKTNCILKSFVDVGYEDMTDYKQLFNNDEDSEARKK